MLGIPPGVLWQFGNYLSALPPLYPSKISYRLSLRDAFAKMHALSVPRPVIRLLVFKYSL